MRPSGEIVALWTSVSTSRSRGFDSGRSKITTSLLFCLPRRHPARGMVPCGNGGPGTVWSEAFPQVFQHHARRLTGEVPALDSRRVGVAAEIPQEQQPGVGTEPERLRIDQGIKATKASAVRVQGRAKLAAFRVSNLDFDLWPFFPDAVRQELDVVRKGDWPQTLPC